LNKIFISHRYLFVFLFCFIITSLLLPEDNFGEAETIRDRFKEAPYQLIAPAFGAMVCNQLFDLYREELPRRKEPVSFDVTIVQDDAGMLAYDILISLEKNKNRNNEWKDFGRKLKLKSIAGNSDKFDRMSKRNSHFQNFSGMIANSFDLDKLISENEHASVVLFVDDGQPHDFFNMENEKPGWLLNKFKVSGLEFLKERKGRQSLDLSLYPDAIFKRLVERGMSPVDARSVASVAIQAFREDQKTYLSIWTRKST